jgi:hypothetical protein
VSENSNDPRRVANQRIPRSVTPGPRTVLNALTELSDGAQNLRLSERFGPQLPWKMDCDCRSLRNKEPDRRFAARKSL